MTSVIRPVRRRGKKKGIILVHLSIAQRGLSRIPTLVLRIAKERASLPVVIYPDTLKWNSFVVLQV